MDSCLCRCIRPSSAVVGSGPIMNWNDCAKTNSKTESTKMPLEKYACSMRSTFCELRIENLLLLGFDRDQNNRDVLSKFSFTAFHPVVTQLRGAIWPNVP